MASSQLPPGISTTVSGWPGGWYVYEDGRVSGPLTAEETFRLEAETAGGKPRMVSRKGFTQWYALKDLSEIFRMTEHLGQRVAGNAMPMPPPHHVPPPPTGARVKGKVVGEAATPAAAPAPVQAAEAAAAYAPPAGAKNPHVPKPEAAPQSSKKAKNLARAEVAAAAAAAAQNAPTVKIKPLSPHQAAMREYLAQRARLRLGKMRNPWASAFLALPLTLGFYWYNWFESTAKELTFHGFGGQKSRLPPSFLAMIPFVHIYMIFRLAKLTAEVEAQNRYKAVDPLIAAVLAIIPPFALAYLQDAVNKHWMLHVRHAATKRASTLENERNAAT